MKLHLSYLHALFESVDVELIGDRETVKKVSTENDGVDGTVDGVDPACRHTATTVDASKCHSSKYTMVWLLWLRHGSRVSRPMSPFVKINNGFVIVTSWQPYVTTNDTIRQNKQWYGL